MSKLDDLIAELCPSGVKYVPLGKVCDISKGVQFNKADMQDEGTYPVINGGINPSGYIEQYNQERDTITVSQGGASAGYVNWIETEFWAGAHCYVLKPSESILNRYLFHFVKSQEKKLQECQYGAGIPALGKATITGLSIPVPPKEIQLEIVRVLDSFTQLTAKLTEELIARKSQYKYYREKLLSFDDNTPSYEIGKVCSLSAGGDAPKEAFSEVWSEEYPIPIISNGIGEKGFYGYTDTYRISDPCVTVAARGAGVGYVTYRDYPFFPIIRLVSVVPGEMLDSKYLYYAMQRIKFEPTQGGIPQLTVPMISKYRISVPSLEKQQEIAAALDNFEKLINDTSEGIPAEITARQKQYEYYRDKLLTFKEA